MARNLQVSNNTAQSVAANGYLNLGTITRRVGCNQNCPTFGYNGTNTISLNAPGYYDISITMNITSTAATQQSVISVIQDGISIASMYAYATVSGEVSTVSRDMIVRVFCNNPINLALQNTGTAADTISGLNVSIIKVA